MLAIRKNCMIHLSQVREILIMKSNEGWFVRFVFTPDHFTDSKNFETREEAVKFLRTRLDISNWGLLESE